MDPSVKVILSIDGDPDPVLNPDPDDIVFRKYHKMQSLVDEYCDGRATITIHSSPVFRQRFLSDDYLRFWHNWALSGKNLALHIEDDLYRLQPAAQPGPSIFQQPEAIFGVIDMMLQKLKAAHIDCRCFRGGSNGHALALAQFLADRGITADLSCAPGLFWPERGVNWLNAPVSAYFAAADNLSGSGDIGQRNVLMIPLGWDGIIPDDQRRPTVNYLANETSGVKHLKRVWDSIFKRAQDNGQIQVVSFLCHTYSVENRELNDQLKEILTYVSRHGGKFISIDDALETTKQQRYGELN